MRGFLAILIPLLLPTILYVLYAKFVRRHAQTAGGAAVPLEMPWSWLAIAGGVLAIVVFFAIYLFEERGAGRYHPAQVIDGEVKPGYFDGPSN